VTLVVVPLASSAPKDVARGHSQKVLEGNPITADEEHLPHAVVPREGLDTPQAGAPPAALHLDGGDRVPFFHIKSGFFYVTCAPCVSTYTA